MTINNRVRELVTVPANSIKPHPENWRVHGNKQRAALQYVLKTIGIAGASVAYNDPEWGPTYIDGHMREEELGEQEVPVLMLDVNREEARTLLLSMDSINAMADRDEAAIATIVREVYQPDGDLLRFLHDIVGSVNASQKKDVDDAINVLAIADEFPDEKQMPLAVELNEKYDYVVILCQTSREFTALCDKLQIKQQQDYKAASRTGLGRVITFRQVAKTIGVDA